MSSKIKNPATEQIGVENIVMRSTELLNKALADVAKNNDCFKNLELVPSSYGGSVEVLTIYFEFRNKHTKNVKHGVDLHAIEFADAIVKKAKDWGFEPCNGAALVDKIESGSKRMIRFGIYGDNQRITEYNILGSARVYRDLGTSCNIGDARRVD